MCPRVNHVQAHARLVCRATSKGKTEVDANHKFRRVMRKLLEGTSSGKKRNPRRVCELRMGGGPFEAYEIDDVLPDAELIVLASQA